jgi:hypothetical protein
MLDAIVRYLHQAHVPFRLSSYPSEEPFPRAAHVLHPGSLLVDTMLVTVDGRPVIAGFPDGEQPDLAALGSALGGIAL